MTAHAVWAIAWNDCHDSWRAAGVAGRALIARYFPAVDARAIRLVSAPCGSSLLRLGGDLVDCGQDWLSKRNGRWMDVSKRWMRQKDCAGRHYAGLRGDAQWRVARDHGTEWRGLIAII